MVTEVVHGDGSSEVVLAMVVHGSGGSMVD